LLHATPAARHLPQRPPARARRAHFAVPPFLPCLIPPQAVTIIYQYYEAYEKERVQQGPVF
jgi:hypothetical protein